MANKEQEQALIDIGGGSRRKIRINGKLYELRDVEEQSFAESRKTAREAQEIGAILQDPESDDESVEQAAKRLDEIYRRIMVDGKNAPDLTDMQKVKVMGAFFGQATATEPTKT